MSEMTVELYVDEMLVELDADTLEVEDITTPDVVELGQVGPPGPQGPPGVGSTIQVLDEGVPVGMVTDVNVVGAGATATVVGSVATITVPGGGGDYHYVHSQPSASDVWVVNHNLGKHPGGVQVYDSDGTEWEALVVRITDNQLEVRLANAMSGVAYLS